MISLLFYLYFTDKETNKKDFISCNSVQNSLFLEFMKFKTFEAKLAIILEECADHNVTDWGWPTFLYSFTLMLQWDAEIKSGCLRVHPLEEYFIVAL